MQIVTALGGNAIARRGAPADAETQRANVVRAAAVLAELAAKHDLVVTHGNGPQVGMLALQAEATGADVPLDVLGAESEGMLGYWIEQEIENHLPHRDVVALLTQVEVDPHDPAFAHATKPIGPVYDEARARRLAETRAWRIAPDGAGWRRVVPSPEPREIVELHAIRLLLKLGVVVVCGGGGGIPVVRSADGARHGVEAVVDKDLSAALLGARLGADALLLLTDVSAVYADWPEPAREPIRAMPPRSVREFSFEPGSMAPKVEAARRFAVQTGGIAVIGALEDAVAMLAGEAGTTISARADRVRIGSDAGRSGGPAGGAER